MLRTYYSQIILQRKISFVTYLILQRLSSVILACIYHFLSYQINLTEKTGALVQKKVFQSLQEKY